MVKQRHTSPVRRWTSPTCAGKACAYCQNDACRHQAIIDVSSYPGDTPVPWFRSKVKCAKCGARNNRIDVRPNWKEVPGTIEDWSRRPAMPGGDR
jgi:hypothetical protein